MDKISKRKIDMAAPKGNEYYKLRTKDGRDKIYTPKNLIEIFNEYSDYVVETPLQEEELFHYQGVITKATASKMRVMSLERFCVYAEITLKTFKNYEKDEDFIPVTTRIREIIESYQFEGAASGFLQPNIIARKLGLVDKKEHSGEMSITWNEEKTYDK